MTNVLLILFIVGGVYAGNIQLNKKIYGVPVYSSFAGWTEANNALDILPAIRLDTNSITDPEIRTLHTFFTSYLNTMSFKPDRAGTAYLWDQRSPLNVLRKHVDDSLIKANGHGDFTLTWYLLAPEYARYGSYIEWHFPYQYFLHFIVPNVSTMIKPDDGEMNDYYTAKDEISPSSLQHYNLTNNMLYCRKQVYKDYINPISLSYYQLRLVLYALLILCLFLFRSRFEKKKVKMLVIFFFFVLLFYCSMLYTTCFLVRYLLPVLPLFTITIFIMVVSLISKHSGTSHT